ncbi:MAG: tRNA dimethylallyltransferase, partial [Cyclobacteriaceae bacterium]
DPDFFDVVDKKNPQRLMRALELIRATGRKASEFRKNEKRVHPFSVVKLGLERDREELYLRINQRVDTMIKDGLLEEARDLYPMRELNALQTVGYQEWFGHFDGKYDFEEAIRLLKRNTRRYAKRQLTWFKKDDEIKWFHPDDSKSMIAYIDGQ